MVTTGSRIRMLFCVVVLCIFSVGYQGKMDSVDAADQAFTQSERQWIESLGVLRVGYVRDRIPISFTDKKSGEFSGVSRLIFDRIQKDTGLKFEYVELPGGSVTYQYLVENKLDLVTSVEYNEQNLKANGIMISRPYLMSKKVIVGHRGVTLESDENLKLAVSTGSQTLKKVLKQQYPNFEIKDYSTIEDCFDAVNKEGEADLLIQNQYVVEYQMARPQYENLTILPTGGLDDKLCFSVVTPLDRTDTSAWDKKEKIIGILNKAIAQIPQDDITNFIIRSDMANHYHDTLPDFLYRYRYSAMLLLAAVLIMVILIFVLIRLHIKTLKAQADAETRTQFLSMMSHEIRTPLNGLIGLNYLMEKNLEEPGKLRGYLKQSSVAAKYLLALVNDILDMSKLQKREMSIANQKFVLTNTMTVADLIERNRMQEKGIDFAMRGDIRYPRLIGDETHIQQVLLNVLDNAYKFTGNGGTVTVETSQEKRRDGKISTCISVTDTGCGISEDFQKKIFDSFTQERKTVSKGNQGTGLGLAISRELARMMGGDLTVRSRLGEGSCFRFTFVAECAQEDAPEEGETIGASQENGDSGRRIRILVAEDNDLNAEILIELLVAAGFDAELAKDGKEAVDRFAASDIGTFDYILMDLLMPVMNGLEAARAIRGLDRADADTVRIIACTANAFEEDRRKALESGMDDFVAKPIDMEKLYEMLNK